jgi:hypothetical protein
MLISISFEIFQAWTSTEKLKTQVCDFNHPQLNMSLRNEVLSLYRKLIRLSYKWESSLGNPGSDDKERIYIRDEARRLFKRNKSVNI